MAISNANHYLRALGEELANVLGDGFKFYKTNLELRRKSENGQDVIILGGSTKWSPYISVSFHYGKQFAVVRKLEKCFGEEPMPYHIHHYSPNARNIEGLEYKEQDTWEVNIEDPSSALVNEIANAIKGIAYPFFERFAQIEEARNALALGDSWCIGAKGAFWHTLLKVDAAIGDIEHFKEWSNCLSGFHGNQAQLAVERYEQSECVKKT
jgi:hypothetical protein